MASIARRRHPTNLGQECLISAGVPQGAVLSPFLFLVYINDVVQLAEESGCEIALFADDIVVWPKSCNSEGDAAVQGFLDKLGPWAKQWKVLFGQKSRRPQE